NDSGEKVQFTGMAIIRIKDGKIIEGWNNFDFLSMYKQAGFAMVPAKVTRSDVMLTSNIFLPQPVPLFCWLILYHDRGKMRSATIQPRFYFDFCGVVLFLRFRYTNQYFYQCHIVQL